MPDNCVTLSSALPTCTLLEHTPPLLCIVIRQGRTLPIVLCSAQDFAFALIVTAHCTLVGKCVDICTIYKGWGQCVCPSASLYSIVQWFSSSLCPNAPLIKICLQIIFLFFFICDSMVWSSPSLLT